MAKNNREKENIIEDLRELKHILESEERRQTLGCNEIASLNRNLELFISLEYGELKNIMEKLDLSKNVAKSPSQKAAHVRECIEKINLFLTKDISVDLASYSKSLLELIWQVQDELETDFNKLLPSNFNPSSIFVRVDKEKFDLLMTFVKNVVKFLETEIEI